MVLGVPEFGKMLLTRFGFFFFIPEIQGNLFISKYIHVYSEKLYEMYNIYLLFFRRNVVKRINVMYFIINNVYSYIHSEKYFVGHLNYCERVILKFNVRILKL